MSKQVAGLISLCTVIVILSNVFVARGQNYPAVRQPGVPSLEELGLPNAEWNADGTRVLSWWENSKTVRLWDASSGKLLLTLPHPVGLYSVYFSPTGTRILTVTSDLIVRVWDTENGKQLLSFAVGEGRKGEYLQRAWWSPDSSRIITWTRGKSVRIWDAINGMLLHTLTSPDEVSSVQLSGDYSRLLTVTAHSFSVWDTVSGQQLAQTESNTELANPQWGADGKRLLTYGNGGVVVWDTISGQALSKLTQPTTILLARLDKQGTRLLVFLADNTAHVWDFADAKELFSKSFDVFLINAQWNRDETQLLTITNHGVQIDDAQDGRELLNLNQEVTLQAGWNQDESLIFNATDMATVSVWDAQTGQKLASLEHENVGDVLVEWSPDGKRILTITPDSLVRVWDPKSGKLLLSLQNMP